MDHDPDTLRDQASDWLVRLRSPECNPAERAAFQAWLTRDPRHAQAFAEAEAQWQWMENFKRQSFHARTEALRYRPRRRVWLRRVVAGSVALWLAVIGFAPYHWLGDEAEYATSKGEHQTVTLADGSRLELNTDSAVRVRFDPWRRRVDLLRGEVFFSVAHEAERVFEVRAGAGRITDLGTAFEVYRQADRVAVAVTEGRVRVEAQEGRRDLDAQQQLAFDPQGRFLEAPQRPIAELTAWRQGRIIFRDRPLRDVLTEVGRYHAAVLRLAQPALGQLRVSGNFRADKLDAILTTIAMTLPVKAEADGRGGILLKSTAKSR